MFKIVGEPVVGRELADRLILERAVDLESVAQLLQITLRGDEHASDKQQQSSDDEGPSGVDSEQRSWLRHGGRAIVLWGGLHRFGYRHNGSGSYRFQAPAADQIANGRGASPQPLEIGRSAGYPASQAQTSFGKLGWPASFGLAARSFTTLTRSFTCWALSLKSFCSSAFILISTILSMPPLPRTHGTPTK